jgi:hypothetical protein
MEMMQSGFHDAPRTKLHRLRQGEGGLVTENSTKSRKFVELVNAILTAYA